MVINILDMWGVCVQFGAASLGMAIDWEFGNEIGVAECSFVERRAC